jgi:hypothetical protein
MSRIDDALKRLTGVVTDSRTQSVLERFVSEGKSKIEEPKKITRVDEHKVAPFAAPAPHHPVHPAPAPHVPAPRVVPSPALAKLDPPPDAPQDGEGGGDTQMIFDYAGFVLHAVTRHKLMATSAFVVMLTLVVAGLMVIPKTYHVEVKLFAQRNAVMTALSNPGRAIPWDADAPTRAAAETVLRRDNVISLVTQTGLINEWDRMRSPLGRAKDWVMRLITGYELTADDKLDALVGMIEARMFVWAGPIGDGTVRIELYWPDPEMAYNLVVKAQEAFLEARQVAETTAITESIALLERYSASLHDKVDKTISEIELTQSRNRPVSRPVRTAAAPQARLSPPAAATVAEPATETFVSAFEPDPELTRVKAQISAKRQEIARLEETRQRQLADLQQKLGAAKTVYTEDHPTVLTLRQNMAAFSYESPQIAGAKEDLEKLEAEYDKLSEVDAQRMIQAELNRRAGSPLPTSIVSTLPPAAVAAAPILAAPPPQLAPAGRDETSEFAGLRLRTELNQLQSILERTDSARIELAVSQAAFKYKYNVITPAELPGEPVSPNVRMILAGGLVLSLLLAVGLAVARDLMSNRILEPWQVQRQLGVPILGTASL